MQKDYPDQWMEAPKTTCSISYMLNNRNRVINPYFSQYLSNVKSLFADNLRAEKTTFSSEKISFSLKLLSGHFWGNPVLRLFEVL